MWKKPPTRPSPTMVCALAEQKREGIDTLFDRRAEPSEV